ncbi:hypothetical protein EVG20_g4604 [Dentipellis fragilis]|uniref:Uncharacterized protein n=1 Tax=Dentipellis fragilis TaxID=205917 RepID=A0A4Y9YW12_9AGAM|nr:hypothetical protein EVG20_g4604 [Dentipellis fragilis]
MADIYLSPDNPAVPAMVQTLHDMCSSNQGEQKLAPCEHISLILEVSGCLNTKGIPLTTSVQAQTVWKKKKTFNLLFFLFIRYYGPLVIIVASIGFFSVAMTPESCRHWMLFMPLGVSLPLTLLPGLIMLVRVYALYGRSKLVAAGLVAILLVQSGAGIWQITVPDSTPVPDPIDNYEFHLCMYAPPKRLAHAWSMYTCISLGYDSLVFFLTLARTSYMFWRHEGRGPRSSSLMDSLVRDGALYFASIFSINLTWVIMIFYAPSGLRDVAAIPSSCITAVLVSRITLNLRVTIYGHSDENTTNASDVPLSYLRSIRSPRTAVPVTKFSTKPPVHAPVSPSVLQIGRHCLEDFDEEHRWHEHLEASQAFRVVHSDV